MAAKPVSADRINARAAKDRAFLKRALKNPGLRSKLDPKYLSKPQQASRALNTRLNAPITPGSTTTERDLAHAARAAQDVRYGPQESQLGQELGIAQTTERDTGSFYDQYQRNLQQHATNVAAFQQGAQQALAGTAAGITGLSGQQGAELQQQANATAVPGMGPAGNLAPQASDAAAIRQALIGSFQAMQAEQGAAANTFADTRANVVAPTEKLAALAQARGRTRDVRTKLSDLKTEEGAFNQNFRDTRRQDEFKNVLAQQTLGLNTAKAAADAASSTPEAVAATTSARQQASSEASTAAKYGYTVHQWRTLGPEGRRRIIDKAKKSGSSGAADTVYTSGPFAGRKKSEIAALSDSERRKIVNDYNAGKGGGSGKPKAPKTQAADEFRRKYGVDLQTTGQHNSFRNQVQQAQSVLGKVGTKDKGGHVTTTQDLVDGMTRGGFSGVPKLPPLAIRAALEVIRYGHITPGTAARMHKAGYSVGTLGYKTGASTRRRDTPSNRNPSGPTSGPSASVPGVGGGAR